MDLNSFLHEYAMASTKEKIDFNLKFFRHAETDYMKYTQAIVKANLHQLTSSVIAITRIL